jgi:hypothetical protein
LAVPGGLKEFLDIGFDCFYKTKQNELGMNGSGDSPIKDVPGFTLGSYLFTTSPSLFTKNLIGIYQICITVRTSRYFAKFHCVKALDKGHRLVGQLTPMSPGCCVLRYLKTALESPPLRKVR